MIKRSIINKTIIGLAAIAIISAAVASLAYASDRFPRPEFESGYQIPPNDLGTTRSIALYYLDVTILFLALCAAAYFAFKKRSRRGVLGTALFSVGYFGFFKKGCVCSLGSMQNVATGLLTDNTVSPTVFLIFALPLVFSLFFGRIFCSGVCPMGALQEFVAFKAKNVPPKISAVMGFIPHVYLGIMILFAATGAGFPICKIDPFAGIFRLSAPFWMMVWGVFILLVGIFVARPYCRFLCPYGLLLGWTSAISKYRIKICKDKCVNCRLCENVCPVDAIAVPTADPVKEERGHSVKRIKLYCALLPVWITLFAASGFFSADIFSSYHPDVRLYRAVERRSSGSAPIESESLRLAILKDRSDAVRKNFRLGMTILGAYLGIAVGVYLIRQSTHKKRETYYADPMKCVACARCYGYCPKTYIP